MSAALRDVCGLNIPKISNTLSALVLICVGQFLGQMKLKFDNLLLLLVAFVIFIQYTVLTPSVALNGNQYKDVVYLIVSSVSALYILGTTSKKLVQSRWGGHNRTYWKRIFLGYGISHGRIPCIYNSSKFLWY